jgi:hypothetical protein
MGECPSDMYSPPGELRSSNENQRQLNVLFDNCIPNFFMDDLQQETN